MSMSQPLNPTLTDNSLLFAVTTQMAFVDAQNHPLSESQETKLIGFQKGKTTDYYQLIG